MIGSMTASPSGSGLHASTSSAAVSMLGGMYDMIGEWMLAVVTVVQIAE